MVTMLTIKEAAQKTRMSEYAIRKGVNAGLYPSIRVCNDPRGKILINFEQFVLALNELASNNVVSESDVVQEHGIRKIAE